jgi:hypothetical protein
VWWPKDKRRGTKDERRRTKEIVLARVTDCQDLGGSPPPWSSYTDELDELDVLDGLNVLDVM